MRIDVRWNPAALGDLDDALNWYLDKNPDVAARLAHDIEEGVNAIQEAPHRWQPHLFGTRRFFLRRFPYTVIYRFDDRGVEILAVAHHRRRVGYWRSR